MTDRLRDLEVFIEIVAQGSLAEAGRRLGMSPPAVTRALSGLEERLGVRLIQRSTRSLHLTEAGHRFDAAARRILADVETAERDAAGDGAAPQGRLTVTAPSSFGRLAVAPVLAEFLTRHPKVTGSLHLWDRTVNLIEEGMDVALRIADLPDSGLIARRLGAVRRVVVASPAYLARTGIPELPDDLAHHRFIAFRGVMPRDRIVLRDTSRTVTPWLDVNDALAARALAMEGHGITVAMSYLVREALADGRLVEVLPDHATPPLPVHLVWPEGRLPTSAMRAFLDHAQPRLMRWLQ